ncbi:MAG: DUF364 domain-containing protein [Sedimenticola sp.]|nr:DUF364 domain-containing protein [Sedimenticola sp.]
MTSLLSEQHDLVRLIERRLRLPALDSILLPPESPSDEMKDNFGFVLLQDGSVGPFYTSLEGTREWIEQHQEDWSGQSPSRLALQMDGLHIPRSAVALGAFNAISQHLMHRSGYDPSLVEGRADSEPQGEHIGLVGFFRPLIERYLARGLRVTVIEKNPARVPPELGLSVHTSPDALADCDYVLCTASTLINNTLESIIHSVREPGVINLIGPSASGLPDALFRRGIRSSGGILFHQPDQLKAALASGEAWGKAGQKYQLHVTEYPGIDLLLERIDSRQDNTTSNQAQPGDGY